MTEEPIAWVAAGMIVRIDEGGGGVSLADVEAVWEAMHEHLAALGLRLAANRVLPISSGEWQSRNFMEELERRLELSVSVGPL